MDQKISEAVKWFREINLKGIPFMLRQNETAFLSFTCVVAAIDALSGYRFRGEGGDRLSRFVREYFPDRYKLHADNLYLFRCRMLHNFSPAYFSVVHASPSEHLQPSRIDDTILDDGTFFDDMREAAERFFTELETSARLQADMLARLQDTTRGGSIAVAVA